MTAMRTPARFAFRHARRWAGVHRREEVGQLQPPARRVGVALERDVRARVPVVREERVKADDARHDPAPLAPAPVELPETLERRLRPHGDRAAVAVGRDHVAEAPRRLSHQAGEDDVASVALEVEEGGLARLEQPRALQVLAQVVGVRAAEAREQGVPLGRGRLGEAAHALDARFFARSMLSVSSIGSGSARKTSPAVRRRIFASSQSDQLSRYQRSGRSARSRSASRGRSPAPSRSCPADAEPATLPLGVARRLLYQVGARADEAHLPPQDVDQLRQLVESRAAEPAADAGDADVALDDPERVSEIPCSLPTAIASGIIVRNFSIPKGRPSSPARGEMKITGRPESTRTATATPAYTGARRTRPAAAAATGSRTRFTAR